MSYHCYSSYGDYLDFKCYNRYKYRFVDGKVLNLKSDYETPVKNHISKLSEEKVKFKEVFEELALYLSDDLIHSYECSNFMCCRYMSYLIHEKISNLNNTNYDKEVFKQFQDFAKELTQKIGASTCKEKFDYLNADVIHKMKILYKLYDYYNELKRLNVNNIDEKNKLCSTLSLLVNLFNDINVHHLEDNAFKKKLEALKKLMESEHTWLSDNTCSSNLKSIRLIKNDPPPEKVLPNDNQKQVALRASLTSDAVQGPKTNLGQHVTQESQVQSGLDEESRSHTASTSNSASELRGTLELKDTLTPEGEFISHLSTELNGRLKNVEMGNILQEREPVGIYTHQSLYTHNTPEYRHRDEMAEERLIENLQTSPIDQEGVLETMKNALSSIVKDVEPGPVLGVSGGMGALFLLFKYTPVGTFFRGGRRINNRIPRTFYGQFPGGLAGYDELYDGALGADPINISYRAGME
ncbi:Plasmodium vivax Vir protein, putative [Plasmodium vivax]|uniref:Vir protein, putative n=1 Tax=Plasmodium vivax TaxID=5855 RepID=A0A1G4E3G2_PLAVI|nr:Plasmodium vivax Vir protein, putative [Plasmodium vivax]